MSATDKARHRWEWSDFTTENHFELWRTICQRGVIWLYLRCRPRGNIKVSCFTRSSHLNQYLSKSVIFNTHPSPLTHHISAMMQSRMKQKRWEFRLRGQFKIFLLKYPCNHLVTRQLHQLRLFRDVQRVQQHQLRCWDYLNHSLDTMIMGLCSVAAQFEGFVSGYKHWLRPTINNNCEGKRQLTLLVRGTCLQSRSFKTTIIA